MAELLEPLIRDDPARTARRLIDVFGSLEGAINASATDLEAAGGAETAIAITSARALVDAALQERVERVPVDAGDEGLHHFLKRRMAHQALERLFAVFLDGSNCYLHSETLAQGTLGSVSAPLDRIVRRARELRASGVLLAHNHPSGDARPSVEDVVATRLIAQQCAQHGIALVGHLVIAGNRVSQIPCGFVS